MRLPKNISEFTDKELADMVRECLYAKGARFAEDSSQYLLVLAVPYGKVDDVHSLPEAMEAFRDLLYDEDWTEREFQIYDHGASQSRYAASYEELDQDTEEEDEDDA